MKKNIAILGSTGSIGTQTLEVIKQHHDLFQVEVLTANSNADLLIEQALAFKPDTVVIGQEDLYQKVADALQKHDIKVFAGISSIAGVVENDSIDIVVTAMVGFAGLMPTINAIRRGKRIALANKETMVVAGGLIQDLCSQYRAEIIPVDSEHSAIFQCLVGEPQDSIEKVILTASGGPFRNLPFDQFHKITLSDALNHPNWNMGPKITVDSATMMNKGLEVIEAKWLFNLNIDQIDVVIHPQSIIHSMVQFKDGSIKAQMGLPDMRLPIAYAMFFPRRGMLDIPRLDFLKYPELSFYPPDLKKFSNLALAFEALRKGGNFACALNAANEFVVDCFLKEQIGFQRIPEVIETVLSKINHIKTPSLEDLFETDNEARNIAADLIN